MNKPDLAIVQDLFKRVGVTGQINMRKRAIESLRRLKSEKREESEKELLSVAIFLIESLSTEE